MSRLVTSFAVRSLELRTCEQSIEHSTVVSNIGGGAILPLLANVFLHEVFDLRIQWWRKHGARGKIVRCDMRMTS